MYKSSFCNHTLEILLTIFLKKIPIHVLYMLQIFPISCGFMSQCIRCGSWKKRPHRNGSDFPTVTFVPQSLNKKITTIIKLKREVVGDNGFQITILLCTFGLKFLKEKKNFTKSNVTYEMHCQLARFSSSSFCNICKLKKKSFSKGLCSIFNRSQ